VDVFFKEGKKMGLLWVASEGLMRRGEEEEDSYSHFSFDLPKMEGAKLKNLSEK